MRVRWTRPALEDLEAIGDYIAADNPAAAYRFIDKLIDRTENTLRQAPSSGRSGRIAGTRELVFADMAYIVVYRVRECADILAVRHTARNWPDSM